MALQAFLARLGQEIDDPEEESFLLFSQSIPSQNLGFVDSKATTLELTVGDRDLVIHQSPTILSSNRGGGTTGAVVWKITPRFASWIASPSNLLFKTAILAPNSSLLELGCGISGIIGLALSPHVASYVLTDQQYVMKLLNQNLEENHQAKPRLASKGQKRMANPKKGSASINKSQVTNNNIVTQTLDWETDEVTIPPALEGKSGFEAVIACDCIYNDNLIKPLVQTCVDACKLRHGIAHTADDVGNPTVCIVAQQLRSAEVFEGWLKEFHKAFRVWRIPDEELIDGLKSDSGFVIHVGILRSNLDTCT
ncbi:Uncharacterized protein BP5553_03166 [Venustampulla echinocandica]|uniref:S-adenosyl-L-methionine-dependent methyltransferase n=1 Tax=Venustampulla echinocandica TaxID=2656787 RepID=A0A370TTG5_9HELO|nr:Uncharacterized protein BP5553_03166 [Venustampulla echinocandica]RDL38826.1 Uncharacterized protein BP5553_03166 [Venustampulla echinocandica]